MVESSPIMLGKFSNLYSRKSNRNMHDRILSALRQSISSVFQKKNSELKKVLLLTYGYSIDESKLKFDFDCDVTFIEIGERAVGEIYLKHGQKGHPLPFDDRQFDLVVAIGLWQRADSRLLFGDIQRCLRQEGRLISADEVGDYFANYWGLLLQLRNGDHYYLAPPVSSDQVRANLAEIPYEIHTFRFINFNDQVEFAALKESANSEVYDKILDLERICGNSLFAPAKEAELFVQKNKMSLNRRWVLSDCTVGDRRRHRVPLVASVLMTRGSGENRCVLLQRRRREAEFWGHWELPQGHVHEHETLIEAALRELFEETGLIGELSETQWFYRPLKNGTATASIASHTVISGSAAKEFVSVAIMMDYEGGEPTSSEDRQFKWANVDEIIFLARNKHLYPLNELVLMDFVNRLSEI